MAHAKEGTITKEMQIVAEKEGLSPETIRQRVASGSIAIPCNRLHKSLDPEGVGEGLRTKINVNLGVSKDCPSVEMELEKVKKAIDMKAEAIMDLSSYGKTKEFRRKLVEFSPAMIGTVPVYDIIGFYERELKDITKQEFLDAIVNQAEDGVDFMTIHAGMNREAMEVYKRNPRLAGIVSRGGSLMYAWMEITGNENPYYEYYDELLDILAAYDITISIGDALRPGAIYDSSDASQIKELSTLGELTLRAWEKNVSVMVEGPGHMAIDEIAANMKLQKRLCHNAPFYVLGPLVTDIAPGYDHITSAIGGAIAASSGADFLCYVTPAEHLRLPTLEDMKEGIIATKIAAHAADIAKKVPGARDWDDQMSRARKDLNWEEMFRLSIDEEKARRYRAESKPHDEESCSMCGKLCAVRTMNKLVRNESLDMLKD